MNYLNYYVQVKTISQKKKSRISFSSAVFKKKNRGIVITAASKLRRRPRLRAESLRLIITAKR